MKLKVVGVLLLALTFSTAAGTSPGGKGAAATTHGGKDASATTPGDKGASVTTPGGKGASATTPGGKDASATTPVGKGASATTPGGKGASATTPGGKGASATTPGGKGASATTPGGKGASATTPGGKGAAATTPGGKGAAATTPGGKGASATTPGGKGASATTPGGKGAAATTPGGKGAAATTPGGKGAAATTPGGKGASVTTPGGKGASATTPGGKGASAAIPGGKGASATTPGGKGASATTPGGKGASATTPGGKGASATTPEGKGASATTPGGKGASATTPRGKGASASTPGGKGASATTPGGKGASATTPGGMGAPVTTPGVSKSTGTTSRVTKTQSTAARKERPTTVDPDTKPNLEGARFNIELKLKVNTTFNETLLDSSSALYRTYVEEFEKKVTPEYKKIPGFLYVEVTGFSKGSVDIHHNLGLRADVDADKVQKHFEGPLHNWVVNIIIFGKGVKLITDITKLIVTIKDKCKAEGICAKSLACTDGTTSNISCQSPCTPGYCHHGICKVTYDGEAICNCEESDDVVYSGETCEVEEARMSMSTGAIAGIAGGVGGGAILLLSIALGCMCCSRRKGKNPDKDMKHEDEMALSERLERDIYSNRQPGQFNYGADIKDEYRYTGRVQGEGYEEWLMSKDRSQHESSGRRRENDFRAPSYSGNWGRNHGDDRRGDNADMEPASVFGRGVRTSGLGTSQYSYPEDVAPDYDHDDKHQMIPHPRDRSRENPYTRMPTSQPPSRPQSSLLNNSYKASSNVYEHIDTNEQYSIKRPNYR